MALMCIHSCPIMHVVSVSINIGISIHPFHLQDNLIEMNKTFILLRDKLIGF